MSIKSFLINGVEHHYDYNALDNKPVIPAESGVSEELKQALLQMAQKVAYIDAQGQTYYQALYDALYSAAVLTSITAAYSQSGTVYTTDTLDSLKPDLTVTAHYDDGTSEVVTNYTLSGNLTVGTSVITVSYGGKTANFNVTVTQVAGTFSISNNLTGCTISNSASTVAENASYNATITANTDYTLTGATVSITMGGSSVTGYYSNGTISIPNVTGDVVITVAAVAVTVSSISAVFNQGDNVVCISDSLDTLKQYLVVTANYSDSSTATVSSADYTLSGTLEVGTSTITVSYSGKTTTFNVTAVIFKNGVYNSSDGQIRFTITNNKHIKAEVLSSTLGNFFMLNAADGNISKSTAASVNNKESFFTIPANTQTSLKMENVSVYKTGNDYIECILLIRKALTTQSFIATSQTKHTADVTVSDTPTVDTDIGAVGFGVNGNSNMARGTYIEFDVEFTVGDTVLIG